MCPRKLFSNSAAREANQECAIDVPISNEEIEAREAKELPQELSQTSQ